MKMKTNLIKLTTVMAMLLLIALSPAWSAEVQSMPGGGGMGWGTTTTITGGVGNTTTHHGWGQRWWRYDGRQWQNGTICNCGSRQ